MLEAKVAALQVQSQGEAPQGGGGATGRRGLIDITNVTLSADCPQDITREMVTAAVTQGYKWYGARPAVFATGRVAGLMAIDPIEKDSSRDDYQVGWGSCQQCDKTAESRADKSKLTNLTWQDLEDDHRSIDSIKRHEVVIHIGCACRFRLGLIREHCRRHPADAWMLVSISKDEAQNIRKKGEAGRQTPA